MVNFRSVTLPRLTMAQLCDQIAIHGVCHRDECTAQHAIHTCRPCRVSFSSEQELNGHLVDFRHLHRVQQQERKDAELPRPIRCTVCSIRLPVSSQYGQHARGRRHQTELRVQNIMEPGPEELDAFPGSARCDIRDTFVPTRQRDQHINGPQHNQAMSYVSLKGALDEVERVKNGIIVSDGENGLEFGILEPAAKVTNDYVAKLFIQNTNSSPIYLNDTRFLSNYASRASET